MPSLAVEGEGCTGLRQGSDRIGHHLKWKSEMGTRPDPRAARSPLGHPKRRCKCFSRRANVAPPRPRDLSSLQFSYFPQTHLLSGSRL